MSSSLFFFDTLFGMPRDALLLILPSNAADSAKRLAQPLDPETQQHIFWRDTLRNLMSKLDSVACELALS